MQKNALKKLTTAEKLPFRELFTDSVDSNLFSYHLKKLVSAGMVKSNKGIYSLTPSGRHYVGSISLDTGITRKQPKIVVMLHTKNSKGELLLYRWLRQPYYGKVSLPYGKTHFNKPLGDNVDHEANMKLSTPAISKNYLGCFYQKISEVDTVISHMLVHVYEIAIDETAELASKQSGKSFWADPKTIPEKQLMPGFWEILNWVHAQKPSEIYEIESGV